MRSSVGNSNSTATTALIRQNHFNKLSLAPKLSLIMIIDRKCRPESREESLYIRLVTVRLSSNRKSAERKGLIGILRSSEHQRGGTEPRSLDVLGRQKGQEK